MLQFEHVVVAYTVEAPRQTQSFRDYLRLSPKWLHSSRNLFLDLDLLATEQNRIKRMMNFEIDDGYFWTDFEIVLLWIKTHSSSLMTFVSNKVFVKRQLQMAC